MCVSSSLGFRKSKTQSCPKAISLPLELVSEQSWLVFTWSLQGWRWLGRPDTVLNQAPQENKKCLQSMSQSVNLETLLGEAGHIQIHRVSVPDCSPGCHSYHSSCANISAEILQHSCYSNPSKLPSLNPPGTCSRVVSAVTQENRAQPSAALALAALPESADEESDGAAPAGTTCAAAASSPASSRPCAPRTSSGAAHTPARNPACPITDLLLVLCAECHLCSPPL